MEKGLNTEVCSLIDFSCFGWQVIGMLDIKETSVASMFD